MLHRFETLANQLLPLQQQVASNNERFAEQDRELTKWQRRALLAEKQIAILELRLGIIAGGNEVAVSNPVASSSDIGAVRPAGGDALPAERPRRGDGRGEGNAGEVATPPPSVPHREERTAAALPTALLTSSRTANATLTKAIAVAESLVEEQEQGPLSTRAPSSTTSKTIRSDVSKSAVGGPTSTRAASSTTSKSHQSAAFDHEHQSDVSKSAPPSEVPPAAAGEGSTGDGRGMALPPSIMTSKDLSILNDPAEFSWASILEHTISSAVGEAAGPAKPSPGGAGGARRQDGLSNRHEEETHTWESPAPSSAQSVSSSALPSPKRRTLSTCSRDQSRDEAELPPRAGGSASKSTLVAEALDDVLRATETRASSSLEACGRRSQRGGSLQTSNPTASKSNSLAAALVDAAKTAVRREKTLAQKIRDSKDRGGPGHQKVYGRQPGSSSSASEKSSGSPQNSSSRMLYGKPVSGGNAAADNSRAAQLERQMLQAPPRRPASGGSARSIATAATATAWSSSSQQKNHPSTRPHRAPTARHQPKHPPSSRTGTTRLSSTTAVLSSPDEEFARYDTSSASPSPRKDAYRRSLVDGDQRRRLEEPKTALSLYRQVASGGNNRKKTARQWAMKNSKGEVDEIEDGDEEVLEEEEGVEEASVHPTWRGLVNLGLPQGGRQTGFGR